MDYPEIYARSAWSAEDYRIYMEDYVYTFLVRLARTEDSLGEAKNQSGSSYRKS